MYYQFAIRKLSSRLDWASHIVAATVFTDGIFANSWDNSLAAASAWLAIQAFAFALNVYAGPPDG